MSKLTLILVLTVVIAGILLFVPIIPIHVAPAVTLQVVDEDGIGKEGIPISQYWGNWSYETTGHEDQKSSEVNGYVTFPEKSIRIPVLKFLSGFIVENVFAGIDIHRSYGPFSSFSARAFTNTEVYTQCTFGGCQKEEPKQIVLR